MSAVIKRDMFFLFKYHKINFIEITQFIKNYFVKILKDDPKIFELSLLSKLHKDVRMLTMTQKLKNFFKTNYQKIFEPNKPLVNIAY